MRLYWHFLPADRRLTNGDGRLVRAGRTLKVTGEPEICSHGLHASKRALDALAWAPDGSVVCRVSLGGTVIHSYEQSVATERTVLWMADARNTLRLFACTVARELLEESGVKDERCYEVLRVALRAMRGEASAAELEGAVEAARKAVHVVRYKHYEDVVTALAAASGFPWSAARSALAVENRRLTAMLAALGRRR